MDAFFLSGQAAPLTQRYKTTLVHGRTGPWKPNSVHLLAPWMVQHVLAPQLLVLQNPLQLSREVCSSQCGRHCLLPAFIEEIFCHLGKEKPTQNPSISALQITQHLTQQISKFCFDAGGGFEKAEKSMGWNWHSCSFRNLEESGEQTNYWLPCIISTVLIK